jgi:uncharacterized membrane protein HdeD (DUF308 family)
VRYRTDLVVKLRLLPHWGYVFFSGITALVFAFIILMFWSETAYWLSGLLVGINMIVMGWSMVKMSLHHKVSERKFPCSVRC